MATKTLDARLAALEKRDAPPARLLVCACGLDNGRENLPDGQHNPDCPVLDAGPRDNVIIVRYVDLLQSPLPSVT